MSLVLSSAAAEAAGGKRIGVPKFEGAQEALVRKEVMKSLKSHGFEVVGSRAMADAISSTGAGLDTDDGLQKLAKELSLSAIVTGEVGPKRAKIVVHDGGEGSILGDGSFSGANPRKLATEVGLTFWKKLGPDVGRGHVPSGAKKPSGSAAAEDETGASGGEAEGEAATAKPKDDAASADEAAAAEEAALSSKKKEIEGEDGGGAARGGLGAGRPVGARLARLRDRDGRLNRALTFNQNLTPSLLSYTLGVGPIAVANVVMYPLDPILGGAARQHRPRDGDPAGVRHLLDAGERRRFAHLPGRGARLRGRRSLPPPVCRRGRHLPLVHRRRGRLHLHGAKPANILNLPDTIYHYVRPGLGVDLAIGGGLSVAVSGGYRVVLNHAGPQFLQFFPHSTVAGADAEIVGRYALSEMFQVRAGVEWRRYWFAMHSVPSDMSLNGVAIAGGAVDQSFAFTLRIAILIGSSSVPKAEGGAEEAPPPPPPNPKGRGRHKSSDEDTGDSDSDKPGPAVESGGDHKSGDDADQ